MKRPTPRPAEPCYPQPKKNHSLTIALIIYAVFATVAALMLSLQYQRLSHAVRQHDAIAIENVKLRQERDAIFSFEHGITWHVVTPHGTVEYTNYDDACRDAVFKHDGATAILLVVQEVGIIQATEPSKFTLESNNERQPRWKTSDR